MRLSDVLKDVAIAISSDASVEAFCQAAYGKSISIYVHIDAKNPPKVSKAPWVGLTVQGYNVPSENNGKIVTFDLESALYCTENGETTEGKITTLDGFENLEDLSDLVFLAIETAISTSRLQLELTYMNEQQTSLSVSDFPGWIASKVFTVAKRK